jgi:DnaJ-class molecular chaperone
MMKFESTCISCGGEGRKKNDSGKGYTNEPCPICGGDGKVVTEETLPEDDPFSRK